MNHRRRELIREYKEGARTSGVGVIRNAVNGKILLIAGVDLPGLLNRHRAQLRFAGHRNAELQRDWNAHGPDAFTFEVLDTLPLPEGPDHDPREDLATLEVLWLEKLNPYGNAGYNKPPSR